MELQSVNYNSKKLIKHDIDIYSSKLNLHNSFIENNTTRNTYYCISWYFDSDNIEKYFTDFINKILSVLNPDIVNELTATVEKTHHYHIHLAIMFKYSIAIYTKLNKIFNNICIETIKCSDFENVKLY